MTDSGKEDVQSRDEKNPLDELIAQIDIWIKDHQDREEALTGYRPTEGEALDTLTDLRKSHHRITIPEDMRQGNPESD